MCLVRHDASAFRSSDTYTERPSTHLQRYGISEKPRTLGYSLDPFPSQRSCTLDDEVPLTAAQPMDIEPQ
jgi:hypothetical protein